VAGVFLLTAVAVGIRETARLRAICHCASNTPDGDINRVRALNLSALFLDAPCL